MVKSVYDEIVHQRKNSLKFQLERSESFCLRAGLESIALFAAMIIPFVRAWIIYRANVTLEAIVTAALFNMRT